MNSAFFCELGIEGRMQLPCQSISAHDSRKTLRSSTLKLARISSSYTERNASRNDAPRKQWRWVKPNANSRNKSRFRWTYLYCTGSNRKSRTARVDRCRRYCIASKNWQYHFHRTAWIGRRQRRDTAPQTPLRRFLYRLPLRYKEFRRRPPPC
jgi:hypothetical protein